MYSSDTFSGRVSENEGPDAQPDINNNNNPLDLPQRKQNPNKAKGAHCLSCSLSCGCSHFCFSQLEPRRCREEARKAGTKRKPSGMFSACSRPFPGCEGKSCISLLHTCGGCDPVVGTTTSVPSESWAGSLALCCQSAGHQRLSPLQRGRVTVTASRCRCHVRRVAGLSLVTASCLAAACKPPRLGGIAAERGTRDRGNKAPSLSGGATVGSQNVHAVPVAPGTQVINYDPNHPPLPPSSHYGCKRVCSAPTPEPPYIMPPLCKEPWAQEPTRGARDNKRSAEEPLSLFGSEGLVVHKSPSPRSRAHRHQVDGDTRESAEWGTP